MDPNRGLPRDENDVRERVEVQTKWFKLKLDDITWQTIIVVGMILATVVAIVYIVSQ
jgi:hypothetical protein